jgi:uncharacterized membrane protein YgdD (TMEM256/DUF423 family)
MTRTSILLAVAGIFGATAVALGAWAAHGLEAAFGPRATALVETGVRYQLWHALAMVGAITLYRTVRHEPGRGGVIWLARAAQLFAAGVILFSGALYALAFGGPRWMGMVAPLGGLAMITGWLALAWGGARAFGDAQSRG